MTNTLVISSLVLTTTVCLSNGETCLRAQILTWSSTNLSQSLSLSLSLLVSPIRIRQLPVSIRISFGPVTKVQAAAFSFVFSVFSAAAGAS